MPTDTGDAAVPATLVVDGNNVMGAAADGWWRDRQGAVLRLAGRLDRYRERTGEPVVLVLDVPHPALPEGGDGGPGQDRVGVRYPARRGRDAADDRIVALLDEWGDAAAAPGEVVVVTSDRGLAERVAGRGARVVGAGTFLSRLRALGL